MARIVKLAILLAATALLFASSAEAVVPPGLHHVCHERSGILYDVWASSTKTTIDRWNVAAHPPRFMDRNQYAALHQTSSAEQLWSEGIDYAAAMQTRQVWVYPEPTSQAFWSNHPVSGKAVWTFKTTIGNTPTDIVFYKTACRFLPPPFPRLRTRVCLRRDNTLFDLRTGPLGTVMHRWNMATTPASYMDRNTFAELHAPVPANAMWGEGVQFAAAMQTRLAWVNPEPNTAAYWEINPVNGRPVWRFVTTVNGQPTEWVFRRWNCPVGLHPPTPVTTPPLPTITQLPAQAHRVCGLFGNTFYDISTDPSGTTMVRWNMATTPASLKDSNWFAALHTPAGPAVNWGEGVAFAATMQTRNAWVNVEPNTAAYWIVGADDEWRFNTVIGGTPTVHTFRHSFCSNAPG